MSGPSRAPWLEVTDRAPTLAELPPALLRRSRGRLAAVALAALVFMTASQALTVLWYLALGRTGALRYHTGGDLVSASVCLVLFLVAKTRRLPDEAALRIGFLLEVVLCASLFFIEAANGEEGRFHLLNWGVVFIAVFPLLVPAPPRITRLTSVAAALTAPLAVLVSEHLSWTGKLESPWAAVLALLPVEIFAVFVALAGSRVLREASVDVLALEQHEELVDTVLKHDPSAVALIDASGAIRYLNGEARRLLGAGEEAVGVSADALFARQNEALAAAFSSSDDAVIAFSVDGELMRLHVLRRPVKVGFRDYTLWLARRLEGPLRAREAAAYKRVIRVFAHEVNNSLGALASMLRQVKAAAARPERAALVGSALGSMEECVTHLGEFFDGYVHFARLAAPRKQAVAWPDFVRSLEQMTKVRLIGTPPPSSGHFDRAQIQQAVLNLVKNAHESGSPEEEVTLRISDDEGATCLEVADRGRGLSAEARELALVPFFTTKPDGTGLGLAISLEIVQAHGGRLQLSSREGGGTSVRCWLPRPA